MLVMDSMLVNPKNNLVLLTNRESEKTFLIFFSHNEFNVTIVVSNNINIQ